MTRSVMLLRGINVGGSGKLKMADLKALLEGLGASAVQSYIQSGNLVFSGPDRPRDFETRVAAAIEAGHGFRPAVLVIGGAAFGEIVAGFPYPGAFEAPKSGHVWFLTGPPDPDRTALQALAAETERFEITERAFYLHAPDGIGRSKLADRVERLMGVAATARNLNTCRKLLEMLDASAHG